MCYEDVYAAQHYTDPNLEQSGRSERKIQNFLEVLLRKLVLTVGVYLKFLEVPQEYYCVYSHLNFVSVELTTLVFHL